MRGGREAGGHRNFGRGTADPTTHCAPPPAVPGAGGRRGGNEGSGHLGAAGKRHGRTTNNYSTWVLQVTLWFKTCAHYLSNGWIVRKTFSKLFVEIKSVLKEEAGRGGVNHIRLLAHQPHIEHLHQAVHSTGITAAPLEAGHTQRQHSILVSDIPHQFVPLLQ